MKILKLLNNYIYLIFFLFFYFSSFNLNATEPVEIWDTIKKNKAIEKETIKTETITDETSSVFDLQSNKKNEIEILRDDSLETQDEYLYGIYDPIQNELTIDMWSSSDGNVIKSIFERINDLNLSKDSNNILNMALLTNSYFPSENISKEEFLEFKLNYLIKNKDLELIKLYLDKNRNLPNKYKLVEFYTENYLMNSDVENACKIFNHLNFVKNEYLIKFKIYCLINEGKREEAQIIFDLQKELGLEDTFFENKFNILMEYSSENKEEISEKNILYFHLSHRTNPEFSFAPNQNTSKLIWRYLSASNLLEEVDSINLEDDEKVKIIEKATSEENYTEEELFDLYKRFQFSFNQLLTAKDSYKLLPSFKGRALIYQRLLLTSDQEEKLNLLFLLKESFINEEISNAFNIELSKILQDIEIDNVPANYIKFYENNLITKKPRKKEIKFNNKVLHQSKLLNYFIENEDIKKFENQTNDLLKKIKKNKEYNFSKKDMMLLESLKSDGLVISNKYNKIYNPEQSIIPPDIELLIKNKETGLILLRLVEIIGEDELEKLGTDSLYFIVDILNKLNIDNLRNTILLKVLPFKV